MGPLAPTPIAPDAVSQRFELSVPALAHGVPAEPRGVVDVLLAATTCDPQVGPVLHQVV